jgi:hypothetical protein
MVKSIQQLDKKITSKTSKETQIKSKLAWRMPQKYCPIYFLRSLSDFSNIWR